MDLGLKNKVALVLASSKGLGLACAKVLYQEGANVMICSRTEEHLKVARAQILELESINENNHIEYVVANLLYEDQIQLLVDTTRQKFKKIDILIHNAGGPPSKPVKDVSKEEWTNSIDLNLRSFVRISRLVLPLMEEQGNGNIIAITSVSVKQPLENLVLSNTTRLGVLGFAKTLSNEYARKNIRVNVVCPGPTLTDRMKELIESNMVQMNKSEKEIKKQWTVQIPMGRMGHPEELAHLVAFLASDRASYITGTAIQCDGGFVSAPF
ncbi:MAG: 3-oxoacyl-[acyl-carrier-protein] reductase FabG [Promethearchaeota archaeon]|nr:MAG: 3-oxoacyl-[acyl-carrier-protein] reductase FabG [Candidatus Lokiarchaeota archaeon]